jgi:SAM-dependent methyltransferase
MPGNWDEIIQILHQYKTGGAILDLGCSSGSFLASLKGPSWKLSGIEMSAAVARIAQERTDGEIFSGEILSAAFPPRSFDVITCFHVLEHMHQPREVLMKVAEWLKPNGIFYIRVPNIEAGEARIFRSYWYALELPRHLFHFSPTTLNHFARSAGLQTVSLSTLRVPFIERSIYYIWDEVLRKLGVECQPPATAHAPSLQWKVIRKILRLTILPILAQLESLAGDGEVIEGVFRNREEYISVDGRASDERKGIPGIQI